MTREFMTAARRDEHATALLAARAAGVRADSELELKGILQPEGYTPVVVATASTIANGAESGNIVITLVGDTFKSGIATSDLTIDVGDTEVTMGSTTRNSSTQITVAWTSSGAVAGDLTIQVKASGLDSTPYCPSNVLTITVPEPT